MSISTTQGAAYIINLSSLETMEIQFVLDELTYTRNANYSNIEIIGRNEPKYHYSGGETTMPLILDFHAQDDDRQDVIRKIKWLEALSYGDGYDANPPVIKIVFGEVFKEEQWIVKSVKPNMSLFVPMFNFLPHQATVSLDLAKYAPKNPKWVDIWR